MGEARKAHAPCCDIILDPIFESNVSVFCFSNLKDDKLGFRKHARRACSNEHHCGLCVCELRATLAMSASHVPMLGMPTSLLLPNFDRLTDMVDWTLPDPVA